MGFIGGFLKILSFSYCFPNHQNPNWGVFVYQRLAALATLADVRVCSPVPWFPILTTRRGNPGPVNDGWGKLAVSRPRFFYLPRMCKNQDARFYAAGLRQWMRRELTSWAPDILDAHFVWPDGVGVALLARAFDIPYAITLRGKLYECLPVASQRSQCAAALRGAAAVISVSSKLADEARQLGVQSDRLAVIPNGVDFDMLHPRDKIQCRRELGLPPDGRLLVTIAHLGHRKGHHEVIRALAGLPPDVQLCIVGGPAQGGTFDTIRSVAQGAGVADRVILPGPQPYARIPLYFGAADASVLASYREGCPNAVLESLACGTPVVATDVGAVKDILPVPSAGRIVPPQDAGALQAALAQVLAETWRPEEVARASGVRSWSQVAQAAQAVIEQALIRCNTGSAMEERPCTV